LSSIKHSLKPKKTINQLDNLSFSEEEVHYPPCSSLKQKLSDRLIANINSLNNCDLVIGVSQDVKKHLMRYGVAEEKILVQHIGSTIADTKIHHSKTVQKEKIIFGFIGGVSYYKGVHQLVDAFISMPENYKKKANLKIFGKYNDNYKESVEINIIQDKTYKDHIIFYGRYSPKNIKNITNEVDIAILPSLCADTAPQTIFESFSSELPIIAPAIGGFTDFIEHKKNGLIYEASNVESLKESLMYIIDNSELIDVMRSNIPKMKTISDNAKELINLYDKLLRVE
jgi:glycosyltransferase involved in cell wall biosynthesis